ncbi:MAG: hypothetical protein JWM28_4362, partial [Chitinophagaceae bacterium]|nr:hypothetical protein [Chitinophagaceae bacterium]
MVSNQNGKVVVFGQGGLDEHSNDYDIDDAWPGADQEYWERTEGDKTGNDNYVESIRNFYQGVRDKLDNQQRGSSSYILGQ